MANKMIITKFSVKMLLFHLITILLWCSTRTGVEAKSIKPIDKCYKCENTGVRTHTATILRTRSLSIPNALHNISMDCPSNEYLKSTIKWFKNDEELHNQSRYKFEDVYYKLEITNLTYEDEGQYTCVVDNRNTRNTFSYKFTITSTGDSDKVEECCYSRVK